MIDMSRIQAFLAVALGPTTNPNEARVAAVKLDRLLKQEGKSVQDLTFASAQVARSAPTFIPASKLRQQVIDLEASVEASEKKHQRLLAEIKRLESDNRALKLKLGDTSTKLRVTAHANKKLNRSVPEDQRETVTIPEGDDRRIDLSHRSVKDRRIIFITLANSEMGMTDNVLSAKLDPIHDATVRSTRALMVREGFVRCVGKVREFASRNRASGVATGRTVSCDAWAAVGTLEDFEAAVARSEAEAAGEKQAKTSGVAKPIRTRQTSKSTIDWTSERKNRVRDLVADSVPSKRIAAILTAEFGQEVTLNAVNGQKNQLGGWKQPRRANDAATANA